MTGGLSDPGYDELFEPLSLSLGHLVIAATALEKALLADLVQRRVIRDGPEEVFGGRLVSRLLNKPAGVLLDALRRLGYEDELASELATVIDGRNHFVHHLFEDPEFIEIFASREGVNQIVGRVESLVQSIYAAAGKLEPGLSAGTSDLFGRTAAELLGALKHLDLDEIDDAALRRQLEAVRTLPDGL